MSCAKSGATVDATDPQEPVQTRLASYSSAAKCLLDAAHTAQASGIRRELKAAPLPKGRMKCNTRAVTSPIPFRIKEPTEADFASFAPSESFNETRRRICCAANTAKAAGARTVRGEKSRARPTEPRQDANPP